MNGGSLRTVLESVHSGELAATSERITCLAMRVGDTNDRIVIPGNDAIQEAHRAGVGDEGANFRFVDEQSHEGQYR